MEETIEKQLEKQMDFTLTRDMAPIQIFGSNSVCNFVCPLPRHYQKVIKEKLPEIEWMGNEIAANINKRVKNAPFSFGDILLGYKNRTKKEQLELLQGFKIERVHSDNRGVYGVWAGGSVDNGDIYLCTDTLHFCDSSVSLLKDMFEPRHAFLCHNVDWYWQALLTREFCIEYFNFLNRLLFEKLARIKKELV